MHPSEAFDEQLEIANQDLEDKSSELEFILSFRVNKSLFGMAFEKIHEVVDFFTPTEYPVNAPGHIGIINLRGNVVPIINPFNQGSNQQEKDSLKYVILESSKGYLVGIIVNKARKIEIDKEKLEFSEEDKVISVEGQPLRFLKISAILKNYEESIDDAA